MDTTTKPRTTEEKGTQKGRRGIPNRDPNVREKVKPKA
jgi:hypothetical protein